MSCGFFSLGLCGIGLAAWYSSRRKRRHKKLSFHGCVVLLRPGEQEDHMARKAGNGVSWVANADRPWDPVLAYDGHEQAHASAKRLDQILGDYAIPPPEHIYTSPLVCCLETAQYMAAEFQVPFVEVEEGLVETICEGWMRQFAVPGADSKWGGPADCSMPEHLAHNYIETIQGPPIQEKDLISEAVAGVRALLRKAVDLTNAGWSIVDSDHSSLVDLQAKQYRWGNFETKTNLMERMESTLKQRIVENPGQTLLFVSHGGPTQIGFEVIKGRPPKGEGGMTAMSVLRIAKYGDELRWEDSKALLENDASHAAASATE